MAIELFLLPMIGTGAKGDFYRPKYTDDAEVARFGAIRYSRTSVCVAMIEAPQTYLDTVAGQTDATRLASAGNIDNVLTAGQANAARTIFGGVGIPAGFINAGDTRRQVIRAVIGMFLFSQRMEGRFGTGFWQRAQDRGITLDSTWADFPQALKDEFIETRDSFGWEGSLGVTNASTLRQILRILAEQFEDTPMFIGGVQV